MRSASGQELTPPSRSIVDVPLAATAAAQIPEACVIPLSPGSLARDGRSSMCHVRIGPMKTADVLRQFFDGDREGRESVRSESESERDVFGISAPGDENSAYSWVVVTRIVDMPTATEKDLNPRRKILR